MKSFLLVALQLELGASEDGPRAKKSLGICTIEI